MTRRSKTGRNSTADARSMREARGNHRPAHGREAAAALTTALMLALAAAPASAQEADGEATETSYPLITGEVLFEFQNDWTYDSNRTDNKQNDLYSTIEPDVSLFVTPELFFNTHLVFEPVKDQRPRENRAFEDEGLFVESLTVNWQTETWGVFGGKFTPNFGICFEAPGVYGADVCEDDIEMTERIGFGLNYTLRAGALGAHTLSGSTFFADTSPLSNSLFTERGRLRGDDGGPSNTENFESFAVAIDGSDIEALPQFRYHVAFAMQTVDQIADDSRAFLPEREGIIDPGLEAPEIGDVDDTSNEYRMAIGFDWPFDVTDEITITPLFEYDRFWNAQGIPEQDRDYLTGALLAEYGGWNAAVASTARLIHNSEGEDFQDYLVQVSAGYRFEFGLGLDLAWAQVSEEDEIDQVFGALVSYTYQF